jgi:hypothetical protein
MKLRHIDFEYFHLEIKFLAIKETGLDPVSWTPHG